MAKKIPTALVRYPDNRTLVVDGITPGCEWVFDGEGVPTRKWEGTCVMLDEDGKWWARREIKPGKNKPENYVEVDFDEVTGKTQGWEPIEQSPFVKFFDLALRNVPDYHGRFHPGTYELVGPKIQGNLDNFAEYTLLPHASAPVIEELQGALPVFLVKIILEDLCEHTNIEGVVWHHPDGRMAKLKGRDLGIHRGA